MEHYGVANPASYRVRSLPDNGDEDLGSETSCGCGGADNDVFGVGLDARAYILLPQAEQADGNDDVVLSVSRDLRCGGGDGKEIGRR